MSSYVGITREKSDQLLRNMVARGLLEPVTTPIETHSVDHETAVHEAGHAVLALAVGEDVVHVSIRDGGGGSMRHRHEPWHTCRTCPDPWDERVIKAVAIDLAGAAAACRLLGRGVEALRTRGDFVAQRAGGDYDDFLALATVVCAANPTQIEAVREWGLRLADQTLARYWPVTLTLAEALVDLRGMSGTTVFTIIASTPEGRELLGIEERRSERVTPTRAWRSTQLWGHTLRDLGGGAVCSLDRRGQRANHPNLREAVYALAAREGA